MLTFLTLLGAAAIYLLFGYWLFGYLMRRDIYTRGFLDGVRDQSEGQYQAVVFVWTLFWPIQSVLMRFRIRRIEKGLVDAAVPEAVKSTLAVLQEHGTCKRCGSKKEGFVQVFGNEGFLNLQHRRVHSYDGNMQVESQKEVGFKCVSCGHMTSPNAILPWPQSEGAGADDYLATVPCPECGNDASLFKGNGRFYRISCSSHRGSVRSDSIYLPETYRIQNMDQQGFASGGRVVLDDGRLGTLCNPRGCFCGPKGEACWDIALDEGGGIQAHGGTFRLVDPHQ